MKLRTVLRLLAAALLLSVTAHATRAEPASARLQRRADAFLAGWLARHPEEATRLGDHSHDQALPSCSRAARESDAAWYAAQRDSFAVLAGDRLLTADRVDILLLRSRSELEWRSLAVERLPERDPGFYLRPLRIALEFPMRAAYLPPCSRAVRLRERLRATPEFLRDARLALTEPSRPCTEAAVDRALALLALCRETVPRELEDCRDPHVQADLAEADSMATAALVEFLQFMREELLPRADDRVPQDSAALAARLGSVAGSAVSLDSLLARARAELAGLPAADTRQGARGRFASRGGAGEVGFRIGREEGLTRVEDLRDGLIHARVVSAPLELRLEIGGPTPAADADVAPLVALGPWDPRGARARLDLGPWWTRGAGGVDDSTAWRLDTDLRLAGEGIPGRAWFASRQFALSSRVRQALGLEAVASGWARYAEELWLGTLDEPRRALAVPRAAELERERLARSIAELMLRADHASLDETARWLASAVPWSEEDARRAAREAAAAPSWMASTVALWGFRDLRADAVRRLGAGFRADRFHDAVLREGAIPVSWMRPVSQPAAGPARRGSK